MLDGVYYEPMEKRVSMFNNRPNECVKLPDGREIWLSRSSAVVVTIIIRDRHGDYKCLLVKRGPGCPDEVGRWVLPCGYVDWDETLGKAALRELFEETGVDFAEFHRENEERVVMDSFVDGQPWHVNSSPSDGKQNISNYFGAYIEFGPYDYHLPKLTSCHCEKDEVAELKWVDLKDLWRYDLGFNHDKRIPMYMQYIKANDSIWDIFTRKVNRTLERIANFFRNMQ